MAIVSVIYTKWQLQHLSSNNDRDMNRFPPSLLYLTIYNPTLQPSGPIDENNEDAEEQAHILFYTSKERAVSRDRMLRQIGLAKALINFSEIFDTDRACDNVHSQSRRLIMVCPEPGFWIHAGIDVARSTRSVDPKAKYKSKSKTVDKGKVPDSAPVYDYEDGSVHDGAARSHILHGYERFKLTHGSFASILSNLGQQALELQLERFWTVWAWSWNLEEPPEFGEDFGPLLHPLHSSLMPIINDFAATIPRDITPMLLTRRYIIPSERYIEGYYSPALPTHLSVLIPPPLHQSHSSDTLNTLASSVDTIKGKQSQPSQDDGGHFLTNMPTINMNMDMRKWNWPGYLTFGKPSPSKSSSGSNAAEKKEEPQEEVSDFRAELRQVEVAVNTEDLEDAISSDSMSMISKDPNGHLNYQLQSTSQGSGVVSEVAERKHHTAQALEDTPSTSLPLPEFLTTDIHVAPFDDPTVTSRMTVHYLIRNALMLVLMNVKLTQDAADIQVAAEGAMTLLDHVETVIYDGELKSVSESLPSATKILQPRDRYIISTGQFTHSSPDFTSTTAHLFNGKAILDKDSEILEVFSRGQNPQHWHIAKRGLGNSTIEEPSNASRSDGAIFMEVFRKETSLTDVDNVLAGVIKKSGPVESSPASR